MTIEQARPASATSGSNAASRPRNGDGDAQESDSFTSVLGAVGASAEAAAPADPGARAVAAGEAAGKPDARLEKSRREARTAKPVSPATATTAEAAVEKTADSADAQAAGAASAPDSRDPQAGMSTEAAAAAVASAEATASAAGPTLRPGAWLGGTQAGASADAASRADFSSPATAKVSVLSQLAAARQQASHTALQARSQQAAAQDAAPGAAQTAAASARAAAAEVAESQGAAQGQAPVELQAPLAAALLTTEFAPGRRLERAGDANGFSGAAGGVADSALSRHALTADAAAPVAGMPIDAGATSMEDRMAAQVSYWLGQKTQNAELTLDTLDGRPVEVHISLTGNEAQVAFRADAGATRELLGSALPHLRALLGSEGLVLSGVTVNDFGPRNAPSGGGQDEAGRRARSGVRQVMAAGDLPAGPARTGGSGLGTGAGRSLDLYV